MARSHLLTPPSIVGTRPYGGRQTICSESYAKPRNDLCPPGERLVNDKLTLTERFMHVKFILPALTEAKSPFWRPIKYSILTNRRLKRGVFRSVTDLQATINRFLDQHNQQAKPFVWTADPDKIIAAVRRGHQVLDSIH
jgi:hypothetical protein